MDEAKQSPRPTRGPLAAIGRILMRAAAALGLLVVLVTATPINDFLCRKLAGPWNDPKGDILIVLGGSVIENGVLDDTSYLRSRYAAEAYRQGGFRKLVAVGGGEPAVAFAMQDFLRCQGIPPEAVVLEPKSLSTRENALFTKELLAGEPGTKVLLTSDYHMLRAHRAFLKAGLMVEPRPIPDVGKRSTRWKGRWPACLDLLQEYGKIAYYRLRGWI